MVTSRVKSLGNAFNDYVEEHRLVVFILFAIILLAMVGYGVLGPDNGPSIIHKKLSDAGYDVSAIEFVRIENTVDLVDGKLYKSSHEIEYAPDVFVDEWQLKNLGVGHASYWVVTPYPELPKPVNLYLRVSVSQDEYDRLSIQANGLTVEEYLEQAIDNMVSDT